MTPKQKATELYDAMLNNQHSAHIHRERNIISFSAKQCALICVEEILDSFKLNTGKDIVGNYVIDFAKRNVKYWKEVKKEIINY